MLPMLPSQMLDADAFARLRENRAAALMRQVEQAALWPTGPGNASWRQRFGPMEPHAPIVPSMMKRKRDETVPPSRQCHNMQGPRGPPIDLPSLPPPTPTFIAALSLSRAISLLDEKSLLDTPSLTNLIDRRERLCGSDVPFTLPSPLLPEERPPSMDRTPTFSESTMTSRHDSDLDTRIDSDDSDIKPSKFKMFKKVDGIRRIQSLACLDALCMMANSP